MRNGVIKLSRKSKEKMHLIVSQIKQIMVEEKTTSPTVVDRILREKYNQTVSYKTISKICSGNDTIQSTATATAPDSTDDEIENLTSIIEKLNKEFDKTDSNSERCRLGDAIGTAMKNREDLLMKQDDRERARQTKDNRPIIIKFGTPEEYNNPENQRKLKETFGERETKKPVEQETESIPQPVVENKPQIIPVEKQLKCECCGKLAHCSRSLSNNMVCADCIGELNERYREDHAEI